MCIHDLFVCFFVCLLVGWLVGLFVCIGIYLLLLLLWWFLYLFPCCLPCVSRSCPLNVGPSFDSFKIGTANPENHDHLVTHLFEARAFVTQKPSPKHVRKRRRSCTLPYCL